MNDTTHCPNCGADLTAITELGTIEYRLSVTPKAYNGEYAGVQRREVFEHEHAAINGDRHSVWKALYYDLPRG